MKSSTEHKVDYLLPERTATQNDVNPYAAQIIFLCLLVAATARRIYHIDYSSLWSDELWGVLACSKGSWWAMIEDLIFSDSHPPGYQTFLYWWMQLFGDSDLLVRLPSALAGIGAVALLYAFGRRFFSRLAGLYAAGILCGSYQAIYYSKEARAYSFLVLLAPASLWCFLEWFVNRNRQLRVLLLYWTSTIILVYMHYMGFVFFCGEVLIFGALLACAPTRDNLWQGIKLFAPVILAYMPWLPVMYMHMTLSPDAFYVTAPDLGTLVQTVYFVLGPDSLRIALYTASFALGAVIFVGSLYKNRTALRAVHQVVLVVVAAAIIPVVVFYVKSRIGQSVYTLRYFIYIIPLMSLLVGYLAAVLTQYLAPKFILPVTVLILSTMFIVNAASNIDNRLYSNYFNEDYRGAAEVVWRDLDCRDKGQCLTVVANTLFDHYNDKAGLGERADFYLQAPEQLEEFHQFLLDRGTPYFYYLEVRSKEKTRRLTDLENRYQVLCRSRLSKIQVFKFRRVPPAAPINEDALEACPRRSSLAPLR